MNLFECVKFFFLLWIGLIFYVKFIQISAQTKFKKSVTIVLHFTKSVNNTFRNSGLYIVLYLHRNVNTLSVKPKLYPKTKFSAFELIDMQRHSPAQEPKIESVSNF